MSSSRKYGWACHLDELNKVPNETWLKALEDHHKLSMNEPPSQSQVNVWRKTYEVVRTESSKLINSIPEAARWTAIFEYELPRDKGRRPDLVILSNKAIIIVEFKDYATIEQAHLDQVSSYYRDLKLYHAESHDVDIYPILALMKYHADPTRIANVDICSPESLAEIIATRVANIKGRGISPHSWIDAEYEPLPSLVGAARMIFMHQSLPRIKRAESAGISNTVRELKEAARQAIEESELHLVLVTGVPGSGKTLVGLQFVHEDDSTPKVASSVFLSGNGPLVEVLQHALRSKVFVQDVHSFLREYGGASSNLPKEHTWIYDEAQRAWDEKQSKSKRGDAAMSEPFEFLRLAERVGGRVTVVALVGEGQEIYVGEEGGVEQWATALQSMNKKWTIHIPPKLLTIFSQFHPEVSARLDLTTSLRSHLAGDVTKWVGHLLNGESSEAKVVSELIQSQGFELYLSRSLDDCKRYLHERYEGELDKRYGMLASSKAKNLTERGVMNDFNSTQRVLKGPWYNEPPSSKRSCCQLKDVMTEFGCQGLELDMPLLCWGDDLTWRDGVWVSRGGSRGVIDPHRLRLNSYRVLLTRGRDGLLVYVPPSKDLDSTYAFLVDSGMGQLGKRVGPILVTAAIIESAGKFMITKCRADDGGRWEFPGGKVEYGESPEECLVREIREELGCEIGVDKLLFASSDVHSDGSHYVILFYLSRIQAGSPIAKVHEYIEWVSREQLGALDFFEGDRKAIEHLS